MREDLDNYIMVPGVWEIWSHSLNGETVTLESGDSKTLIEIKAGEKVGIAPLKPTRLQADGLLSKFRIIRVR